MDRFIVGTGRCGSTLLSRMLRCNPELLDLSEFYSGLDWNRRLQPEPMSRLEFRDLITAPHPFVTMALQRGYLPAEVTYPVGQAGAGRRPEDPLPWAIAVTLPSLTSNPEPLYGELCQLVEAQPPGPPAEHARTLFAWLTKRMGRSVWVERSGAAITWLDDLARAFPDARFLHLHRAGEEAALSMREHAVFRLAVMLTYQLPLGENAGMEELSRLGENPDHVARLLGVGNGVPNGRGRLTKILRSAPGFVTWILAYDGLGNPTIERFIQGGNRFDFSSAYDQLGQLVQRSYPSASSRVLTWATDARGFVTAVTTAGVSYASGVQWDPQLRLKHWLSGSGVATANTFDQVTGRLSQVSIGSIEQMDFSYRTDDLLDGITGGADGDRSFQYDGMKRLVQATGPFGSERAMVTRCYGYDDLGNLARLDGSGTGTSCTSGGRAFTYPANTAPRPHAPDAIDGGATGYDDAGNLTSALGRTYDYDNLNRLLSVQQGSTSLGGFAYGGDDRLIQIQGGGKTKMRPTDDFEWTQGDNLARVYVHLGGQVIAVHEEVFIPPTTGGGGGGGGVCAVAPLTVPRRSVPFLASVYLLALGLLYVGLRLPRRRRAKAVTALGVIAAFVAVFSVPPGLAPVTAQAAGTVTYYHQDHLGSTTVVTGGPSSGRLAYAPFGATVAKTGQPGVAPDVGFTGQRFEAPVGLYDYGARWYHPELGRFLTPDSLVPEPHDSQSLNRYAYVRNNPINRVDPDGNDDFGFSYSGPDQLYWDDPNGYNRAFFTGILPGSAPSSWTTRAASFRSSRISA